MVYDYTGMTADKRRLLVKDSKLANEYGADYTNMTEYSYNKYIISMQFIHGMKLGKD